MPTPKSSARPPKDSEREERIQDEVIVDCYNEEEQASGWFCYLEDRLACPFTAECSHELPSSPLKTGEKVTVLKILDLDPTASGTFLAQIEWHDRKLGIPLSQLRAVDADEATTEALADWSYWVARGYSF